MEIERTLEQYQAWYAIITRYRNEKNVAKQLTRKDFKTFIPLQKVVRKYASGRKTFDIPLISCYVFVKMNIRHHVHVLEIPGVINFVRFCNQIVEVPEDDIKLMQRIISGEYPLEVLDHEVKEGDAVEVIAGRLIGVKGHIIRINNKRKLVVSIDNIGRSITIEIDAKMLAPIGQRGLARRAT